MAEDKLEQLIGTLGRTLAEQAAGRFENQCVDMAVKSPIEHQMGTALLFALLSDDHFGGEPFGNRNLMRRVSVKGPFEKLRAERLRNWPAGRLFDIQPQMPIGKYCADFFVDCVAWLPNGSGHAMAVIECDGHDYHERTKEQARHDKARDRYFASLGLIVLRYTGSEIHRDPLACAVSALKLIEARAQAQGLSGPVATNV